MNLDELRAAMAAGEEVEYHITGREHNATMSSLPDPGWYPVHIDEIYKNGDVEISFTDTALLEDSLGVTVLNKNIPIAFRRSRGMSTYERRRLFFAAMRRPEMRLLRQALWHLRWDRGVDWRTLTRLDCERYGFNNDCWFLLTDHHICITLDADNPKHTPDDFLSFLLHDENNPLCDCDDCREARICHIRLKHQYIAAEEVTR